MLYFYKTKILTEEENSQNENYYPTGIRFDL